MDVSFRVVGGTGGFSALTHLGMGSFRGSDAGQVVGSDRDKAGVLKRIGFDAYEGQSKRILERFSLEEVRYPWLDVGSGSSWLREVLFERHRGKGELYESDIDLDVSRYSVVGGHFRTVTSFEVLEHLFNPLFHLMELRRVLHPEGSLYLTTPNDMSLIYKAEHLLGRKYRPHFHQFSERDLRDILEHSGFRIEVMEKFSRGYGTLARLSRNCFYIVAR